MNTTESGDGERWSELRQAHISPFEARLYLERAGLPAAEAVKWWERDVFSAEAARAIAEGRTIDEEVERRETQVTPRGTGRRADANGGLDSSTRDERASRQRHDGDDATARAERDRLAAERDFLVGLSPRTAGLVSKITRIGLDAGTDYPCRVQVAKAALGRMMCTDYHLDEFGYMTGLRTEFDATFEEVLQIALESSVYMVDIDGLHDGEEIELLIAPEYWPTISLLVADLAGESLWVNGEAYTATDDGLVPESI